MGARAPEPLDRRRGPGRRGAVGPGARRPAPTARLISPSWKGVALMLHRLAGLALAVLALLALAGTAAAAPVTVDLRVEGPTGTVFEGPVTTDVRPFQFTAGADTAPHECDATAANTGPSPVPVPTRGAAGAAAPPPAPV